MTKGKHMVTSRIAAASLIVLLGSLVALAQSAGGSSAASKPAATTATTQPVPKITISKETTYYLGPVNADGTIDYLAAINDRWGKGVTPENNAAVLLLSLISPKEMRDGGMRPDGYYEQLLKALKMPRPAEAQLFITGSKFFEKDKDAQAAASEPGASTPAISHEGSPVYVPPPTPAYVKWVEKATAGAWSAKELPGIARWVAANEKPLATLAEAVKRPRYFVPLISSGEQPQVIGTIIPPLGVYRDAARALTARAMLRLNDGDIAGAQEDLMTNHRLARLLSQDSTLIGQLVAIAIEALACNGDKAMAVSGKLSAKQDMEILAQLQKLPPVGNVIDTIDGGERAAMLDAAQMLGRRPIRKLFTTLNAGMDNAGTQPAAYDPYLPIDVDTIMKNTNAWYDKYVQAAGQPTFAKRQEALAALMGEIEEVSRRMGEYSTPTGLTKWFLKLAVTPPEKKSVKISKDLSDMLISVLMPTLSRAFVMQDQARERSQLAILAYALAAYKADKGSYPASLADLAPTYLKEIPKDIFTDKDLIYRKTDSGFILYSVGENQKDDGGKFRVLDANDDIVVKTPE